MKEGEGKINELQFSRIETDAKMVGRVSTGRAEYRKPARDELRTGAHRSSAGGPESAHDPNFHRPP